MFNKKQIVLIIISAKLFNSIKMKGTLIKVIKLITGFNRNFIK